MPYSLPKSRPLTCSVVLRLGGRVCRASCVCSLSLFVVHVAVLQLARYREEIENP